MLSEAERAMIVHESRFLRAFGSFARMSALEELLAEHDRLAAEVERLRADAALGAAVRRMADYARRDGSFDGHDVELSVTLGLCDPSVEEWRADNHMGLFSVGATPDDALRAAGLMKEPTP